MTNLWDLEYKKQQMTNSTHTTLDAMTTVMMMEAVIKELREIRETIDRWAPYVDTLSKVYTEMKLDEKENEEQPK